MDTLVLNNNGQKNAVFNDKNTNVPNVPNNSDKLNIFKKYDILGGYIDTHTHTHIRDNEKVLGLSGTEQKNTQIPDPRFTSKSFRQIVRFVLDWLGEPQTFSSFQKWQAWGMDWQRQYEALVNPIKWVQCYILDGAGRKIWLSDEQRWAKALVTETEFQVNEKVKYEFYRWWNCSDQVEIVDPGQS